MYPEAGADSPYEEELAWAKLSRVAPPAGAAILLDELALLAADGSADPGVASISYYYYFSSSYYYYSSSSSSYSS